MRKIRRRLRDRVGFRLIIHLIGLVMMVGAFSICCGLYRATGDDAGLADGDLVLYLRINRGLASDDEVLYADARRFGVAKVGAMRDGVIYGRVLARLQVRGFSNNVAMD